MNDRREQTRSLIGPTPYAPAPEPQPASNIVETPQAPAVRPECRRCRGAGYIHEAGDAIDCPACTKPVLSPLLEQLRLRCQFSWISAVDCGDCPDGVLWVWHIFNAAGQDIGLPIEHGRHDRDRSLQLFMEGYARGMHHIPF